MSHEILSRETRDLGPREGVKPVRDSEQARNRLGTQMRIFSAHVGLRDPDPDTVLSL